MKTSTLFLLSLVGLALGACPLYARTISWSNTVFDQLYDSTGATLDSSFSFEVGTFVNGFTPTGSNIADWNDNWIVFDLAFHDTTAANPADGGWNVALQFFAGSANHQIDGSSDDLINATPISATPPGIFPQNSQAYLWVYDTKTIDFTSEWALVADLNISGNTGDRWLFPSPADQISPTLTWSLSDAETAIFGAVQSGASEGAGTVNNQPASYSLQTYQVPEPGGALLVACAGFLLMFRRGRFTRR